jgi:hypothetical protein
VGPVAADVQAAVSTREYRAHSSQLTSFVTIYAEICCNGIQLLHSLVKATSKWIVD